ATDLDAEDQIVRVQIARIRGRDHRGIVEGRNAIDRDAAPGDLLDPDLEWEIRAHEAAKSLIDLREVVGRKADEARIGTDFRMILLPDHPLEPVALRSCAGDGREPAI